jgi:Zn-dependent membrane protease YugP
VLSAAALTYVAAAATALAQLFYFIVRYQMATRRD